MPKVLAVTTSLLTRWECYSQALISRNLPNWQRVVVDGRKNWTPTSFIEHVIDKDSDFIVHIDEDCFVVNSQPLERLINTISDDPEIVAAGIPDGGHYYRRRNAAALNLFFVVFRTAALRTVWANKEDWKLSTFRSEYRNSVLEQQPDLDLENVSWDEAEPYYPLFWSMLAEGGRFLYLNHGLDRTRWSSIVYDSCGEELVEHLWYLRQWFSNTIMPGHDCTNRIRYMRLRQKLMVQYGWDWRFRYALFGAQISKLIRIVGLRNA